MDKNKILKYAAVFILIIGIAYFWNRLSPGAIDKNFDTPTSSGSDSKSAIELTDLDKVTGSKSVPSVVKEYEGFTVDFNPENKTPNYVAWILHGSETEGSTARSNNFWTDQELEGCPDTRDYSRSGYDRGHMCPAGEQKWSEEAMLHSFVMANICPQKHELNTGAWKTLEDKERVWAKRDSAIVIIAGPIYDSSDKETIGRNKVRVPSAFFKVLLAPFAKPMRAIGFVYPNMKCDGNMQAYAVSVDDVEKITGFDFFSALPDEIENDIESVVSFREWNSNKKKQKNNEGVER
ncbi:MAG: DNA/RNA non-specific endonuclease [Muribaculaceae bacterium]|nr:DNA/RNA non-specific endonuclease [Muribaculaceae bacterium]